MYVPVHEAREADFLLWKILAKTLDHTHTVLKMCWRSTLRLARPDCVWARVIRSTVGNKSSVNILSRIGIRPQNQCRRHTTRTHLNQSKRMWRNNNKIVPDEKKCYKCGSKTHSVFDCPKRSEIEKTFSLYDWIQYAKHGKADHGSIRESGWEPRDNKSIYGHVFTLINNENRLNLRLVCFRLRWLMTSDEHTRIRSLLRKRASK